LVEMNNPGVWIFGEVRKHVQAAGMAVVVEYADHSSAAQWQQPADLVWNYEQFSTPQAPAAAESHAGSEPAIAVPLVLESKFRGHGAMEAWMINGKSYPDTGSVPLERGRRYRLQFINKSLDDHPLHLHRHSFELRGLGAPLRAGRGTGTSPGIGTGTGSGSGSGPRVGRGIIKDVVLVDAQTQTDVEFTADNPGATLFHCHQQNHMDLGFMLVFNYA